MTLPLGTLIRTKRQFRCLSQDDLAAATGVSRQTISLWERNALVVPTMDKLLKVTDYLEINRATVVDARAHLRLRVIASEKAEVA